MSNVMTPYDDRRTALALDLVNSFDPYYDQPESLREPADLARFLERWDIAPSGPLRRRDLERARSLRSRLRAALKRADPVELAATVNNLLAGARVLPRLTTDDPGGWRLALAAEADLEAVERLEIEVALGVGAALERFGHRRLRLCQASPCEEAFIDSSRNRSRRYCSERCANRHNVAAFRRRRGSAPSG